MVMDKGKMGSGCLISLIYSRCAPFFSVDSGGQYLDGTTDVTRTFYYGPTPPSEVVDRYTRVLMGAIDLARAVFPDGTLETSVDYATRQHLFRVGLDYECVRHSRTLLYASLILII